MDCSPLGSSVHETYEARILEWVATGDFLLQRIFPTQGSNPGLLYCRQILYQLSYKESPTQYSNPKLSVSCKAMSPGKRPGPNREQSKGLEKVSATQSNTEATGGLSVQIN